MVFNGVSKYHIREALLIWSLRSQCAISTCCARHLNGTFSLVRRLLGLAVTSSNREVSECNRVQVIALNSNLNQRMAVFDDVLNE